MTRTAAAVPSLGRCLGVWAATTLATGTVLGWLLPHLAGSRSSGRWDRFETALVVGCEAVAAAGTAWLWLLVTLVVHDALRRRDPRGAGPVPAPVRRAVLAACGLSLVAGAVAPAHAGSSDPRGAPADLLVGLRLPGRASAPAPTPPVRRDVRAAPVVQDRERTTVVVAAGDTLWGIAARTLPPGSAPAEVDRRWRGIYRTNVGLVGPDPHLIRPGQRLVLPHARDHREE